MGIKWQFITPFFIKENHNHIFMKEHDNLKELKHIIKIDWPTLEEIREDLFKGFNGGKNGKRK